MPTLGFLKKKKTKDSTGSQTSDPSSPVAASSSASAAPQSLDKVVSRSDETAINSHPAIEKEAPDNPHKSGIMQSDIRQQNEQLSASTQAQEKQALPAQQQQHQQQNAPSMENLIHHSRNGVVDGEVKSTNGVANTTDAEKSSDGTANTASNSAMPSQVPQQNQLRATKGKYTLSDFTIQRTLGTGSFGRVHLVQSKHNQRFYAIKVLKKAQVVKMKQVEHTNDERKMLQKVRHPFLVTLWGTFQDSKNLYMVMDFVEGGELFSLLRKSQVS